MIKKIGRGILNLDRRIIYSVVLACVTLPLIFPIGMKVTPTPEVEIAFNDIEALNPGSAVLISADYGPSSMPETHPMYIALLHQCFRRGLKPIILTLVPSGPGLANKGLYEVVGSTDPGTGEPYYPGLQEGVDYAFLGYKPGGSAVMLGMGQGFTGVFPNDYDGDDTDLMPIFKEFARLGDCDYIFDIASVGYPEVWVPYASERENVPLSVCCTAVSAAQYYPYYTAGQFRGLVGGMKGSAEYEVLVGMEEVLGKVPPAVNGMDAQSVVHVLLVLAIIIANVFFFMSRRWDAEERRKA